MTDLLRYAVLLVAVGLAVAEPGYFPLAVGNQWIYRCARGCFGPETLALGVIGTASVPAPDGSPYYILRGFAKDYWVRMADSNRLVARDPEGSDEKLWYDFSAPKNEEYFTFVHPCNVSAKITSRKFPYSGPLGDYESLRVEYPATTCNLQGLVEEIFLPGIGLARRVDLVPGSRAYELTYARIADSNVVPKSQIAFGLALDRAVYSIGQLGISPEITARITLKNTTPDPLHLTFPMNPYDLEIRNEQGETVYLWSQGRVFPTVVTELDLSPGEQTWVMVIPLETDFSRAWPPGLYTAEARVNTERPGMYVARVGFNIRWAR